MIPVNIMLKKAVLESVRVEAERFTPFIARIAIMQIDRAARDIIENTAVNKNDLRILFSLDWYAKTIEKYMIEMNIKNSTTTKITNNARTRNVENFPEIIVESKSFSVSNIECEPYMIKSEITRQAKLEVISIIAVKYFEFINCFFDTGRVWVRYDSSL